MTSIIQTYSRKIRGRFNAPLPAYAARGTGEIGGKRFRVHPGDEGIPSRYRKRRRNRRLAMATSGMLAFGGLTYGLFALAAADSSAAAVCNAASMHDITVAGSAAGRRAPHFDLNVFNSTKRDALAADTAAQLKLRGFTIDLVTNDPLSSALTIPAQVRGARSELTELREVAAQVPGAQIVTDSRTDPSVDLTLGSGFTKLAPRSAGCAH